MKVRVTAQHRDMLDQVLRTFAVTPDYDLTLMQPGQTLSALTANIAGGLEPVLQQDRPDVAVVQGDTTTMLGGALAALYQRILVGTRGGRAADGGLGAALPGGDHRVLTTRLTALHFAPRRERSGAGGKAFPRRESR